MAVLLFGIVLTLFPPFMAAAPWNVPREHDNLAPPENGFVFPFRSFHFPDQFQNISRNFYSKNQQFVFEKGNASLNAFFAIRRNESDSVHEIYLSRDNEMEYSHDIDDNVTWTDYYHEQRFTLFSRSEDRFSWRSFNGTTKVNIYSNTGCITYIVNRTHNGRMKIKFYTNANTTDDDDMKIMKVLNEGENFEAADKKMCGIQVPKNLILGNYIFIPFSIIWEHQIETFTLEMGNEIKLAFYEGQYENPPRDLKWPLPILPPIKSSKIPMNSFLYGPKEDGFEVHRNFGFLILFAILCFLLLASSVLNIFLCCCSKSK